MPTRRAAPSYKGLKPASKRATAAARGASKKRDTSCELRLRKQLWAEGGRYTPGGRNLAGRPDLVFSKAKLVVFCDGDFWHGRNWEQRKAKLSRGHNAAYWIAKIERNRDRDRRNTRLLEAEGWTVLRFWESEIKADLERVVSSVLDCLDKADHRSKITP